MRTSQRGLDLIKGYEKLRLTAYKDSAGVWTIGYGHTRTAAPGMQITEDQADALLREDLRDAEDAVNALVTTRLNQGQFDALVSWTFNLGQGALAQSSMLDDVNAARHAYVPREMTRWVHAGGRPLKGLARRRVDEAKLYLED